MKYCPTCQTEFDEDVIRFCTKDGTPLVEDDKPVFTDLPSESSGQDDADEGEQTIIRRKTPAAATPPSDAPSMLPDDFDVEDSQRIVISTEDEKKEQVIRPKAVSHQRIPEEPKRSNTAIIVLLTIIATVLVLLGIMAIYWVMNGGAAEDANSNLNVNENIDLNENLDDNFNLDDFNINGNSNLDSNFNINSNSNFNISTPSPTPSTTPTPTPTTTPTPTPTETPTPTTTPTPRPTLSPRPTIIVPSPRPPTPRPPTPPANSNTQSSQVNVGTINGRAVTLPVPVYPSTAREARAAGRVSVAVTLDPRGNVQSAKAVSGHPLLRNAAEDAALKSKFKPVSVNGKTVAASGTINYNFVH